MEKEIKEIIIPILDQHNAFLIDLKIGKTKGATHINIFVDKESVLTIDECYQISKDLKQKMMTENLWNEGIRLEVSSPGADRPLKYLKQYTKYIGKTFKLKIKEDNIIKNEELILEKIEEEVLFFTNSRILNFNQIIEAKVKISLK